MQRQRIQMFFLSSIYNYIKSNIMKLSRPQYGLEEEIVQAIYALRQKKSSEIFREAVDVSKVPDYYDYIKQPMDLTKILTKLKAAEYSEPQQIHQDLELIISNCKKYNRADAILKKADQFMECIKTVWGNFQKEINRKGISYRQKISINEELLKRIAIIEEKRTKKKIPALQAVIEQEKKNILPESNILPPIQIGVQRIDKDELPPWCQFNQEKYISMDRDEKRDLYFIQFTPLNVMEEFEKISDNKLIKYRKIIKKKLEWFDQKIIQKCLKKKTFQKMQVPKHLNLSLENGNIAEELNIRKLQMYVKKITYWVQDNSNILSDYMKDKFVENCRSIKKSIIRVLRYKKYQKSRMQNELIIDQNVKNEGMNIEVQKEDDSNYQNKMKEFKRMLDRDRQKSTKRDTKIILKNQNGMMQVFDWTSDKKQDRIKKQGSGGTKIEQVDNDEKKKQQERKKQEMRRDEQFLEDYSKKSNSLLILKYGSRLGIDWETARTKEDQFNAELKQIFINFTDDDNV